MAHINFEDYLNFKIFNEPLNCNCEVCQEKFENWEREREILNEEISLKENFWKKQESIIYKKLEKKVFSYKRVLTLAISLIIILGFIISGNLIKSKKIMDYDKEYAKYVEILREPQLGDLEACSIIFLEDENLKEGI